MAIEGITILLPLLKHSHVLTTSRRLPVSNQSLKMGCKKNWNTRAFHHSGNPSSEYWRNCTLWVYSITQPLLLLRPYLSGFYHPSVPGIRDECPALQWTLINLLALDVGACLFPTVSSHPQIVTQIVLSVVFVLILSLTFRKWCLMTSEEQK